MNESKWEDLVGRVRDAFTVEDEYSEALDTGPGTKRVLIFTSPHGRIKLEYVTQPVVLDTRGLGSRRSDTASTVTHQYSSDETKDFLNAFRWEHDDWQPMSSDSFAA